MDTGISLGDLPGLENHSIADRELSRHHSTVECDDRQSHSSPSGGGMDGQGPDVEGASGRSAQGSDRDNYSGDGEEKRAESDGRTEFFLCDVGSTNGTYVQVQNRERAWLSSLLSQCVFAILFLKHCRLGCLVMRGNTLRSTGILASAHTRCGHPV